MLKDYPFTALEYSKILGISKECLRGRRRAGKLEGEYIVKDNCYFYARIGPKHVSSTPIIPPKKKRRRGISYTGEPTKYKNVGLQNHNEMKMLLKLQKRVDPKLLALVPEACAMLQEKKLNEQRASANVRRNVPGGKVAKDYGGIYHPSSLTSQWKSLDAKPKKKSFSYY